MSSIRSILVNVPCELGRGLRDEYFAIIGLVPINVN